MIWTKEMIKEKLLTSDKMVEKSLLVIYARQTRDEQTSQQTHHNNGVGFNGLDAQFMSSLAESLIKYNRLTPKQILYARKKLLRYTRQLVEEANIRIQIKETGVAV